ncbi:hypothetical protein [Streptomyces sp. NPDC026673]|uniref:hypothetical protein n=1 Tax=Streptomyces sp. NPDC026673 TaxID=3155724 RepID=UPI0033FCF7A3
MALLHLLLRLVVSHRGMEEVVACHQECHHCVPAHRQLPLFPLGVGLLFNLPDGRLGLHAHAGPAEPGGCDRRSTAEHGTDARAVKRGQSFVHKLPTSVRPCVHRRYG